MNANQDTSNEEIGMFIGQGAEEDGYEEQSGDFLVCPHEGCDKKFHSRWSLTRHIRTHTGEKPFVCNYPGCGKNFVQKCSLKRHLQTHSVAKEFCCPDCNKRFKLKEYLEVHRKTHDKDIYEGRYIKPAHEEFEKLGGAGESNGLNHVAGLDDDESKSKSDASGAEVIQHLRQRLVRNSVNYHEELLSKQEIIDASRRELAALDSNLCECASALVQVGELLLEHTQEVPKQILYCIQKYAKHATVTNEI